MAEDKVVVTLDSFEQRLMVSALTDFRKSASGRETHGGCGWPASEGH